MRRVGPRRLDPTYNAAPRFVIAGVERSRHNERVTFLCETRMSDDANMRARLQNVAAYRELCRGVQRGGRENVVFAVVMSGLAYLSYSAGVPAHQLIPYAALVAGELLVGLIKWLAPSAECMILDALVLLAFAGYNFYFALEQFQRGAPVAPTRVVFGLLMLYFAFGRLKSYAVLRQLFAERPAPEHLAWFDDLVHEIQTSDPAEDQLALDLPTHPHWRAKLLGGTAFFVANGGNSVLIVGPGEFGVVREKVDHGTGRRKAMLRVYGEAYPEFDLGDASWSNYVNWMAEQAAPRPRS